MRKASHWNKPMPKWALVDDINEWIATMTKDKTDGLKDANRITKRDLETICRAIEGSGAC